MPHIPVTDTTISMYRRREHLIPNRKIKLRGYHGVEVITRSDIRNRLDDKQFIIQKARTGKYRSFVVSGPCYVTTYRVDEYNQVHELGHVYHSSRDEMFA